MDRGSLFIVSTPIGNLEDITIRSINILKEADLVLCESIKKARVLFNTYNIKTPLKRYWDKNKNRITSQIVEDIKEGKNVALITDAGTPTVSDPGYYIVKKCIENDLNVVPVPGPSALLSALVVSGLPTDRFVFVGFLARKGAKRKKELEELMKRKETVVVYESVHRIEKLISEIAEIDENREIAVCRELTKMHESVYRGKAIDIKDNMDKIVKKGEFVVVIGGYDR